MPTATATNSRATTPPPFVRKPGRRWPRRITSAEVSYGDDAWTERVGAQVREIFETDCQTFIVFNGTAANALALAQLCRPFDSVLCHERAHIETDECGAPEFFSGGAKLLTARRRERQARSRGSGRGAGATARCAFDQGARAQRDPGDGAGDGLFADELEAIVEFAARAFSSSCTWMARVSPTRWPR